MFERIIFCRAWDYEVCHRFSHLFPSKIEYLISFYWVQDIILPLSGLTKKDLEKNEHILKHVIAAVLGITGDKIKLEDIKANSDKSMNVNLQIPANVEVPFDFVERATSAIQIIPGFGAVKIGKSNSLNKYTVEYISNL